MIRKTKIVLTPEQMDYLREHYPTEPQCDIAEKFHVSPPIIRRIAQEMGLKKVEGWGTRQYCNRLVKTYTHERYSNFQR